MKEASHWERVRQLGEGGQSSVHLVRSEDRQKEIKSAQATIYSFTAPLSGPGNAKKFASAITSLARPDETIELGALKIFDKTSPDDRQALQRLEREIEILHAGYAGLPKLLDHKASERWLVTEFFPKGSTDKNLEVFKGDASKSLRAIRSLVSTVSHLHREGIVHRDIKPANIFLSTNDELILGDFGIAHRVGESDRLTFTNERVGPRDFMPPWADTGERLDEVAFSFDVYMLGKLLWCMVSGKNKLPREYHRRPEYDLMSMFPQDDDIGAVNAILDKTIVEQQDQCFMTAGAMLPMLDAVIEAMDRGLKFGPKGELQYPCLICRNGHYISGDTNKKLSIAEFDERGAQSGGMTIRNFECDVCTHRAFFSPRYPDEAARWGFVKL